MQEAANSFKDGSMVMRLFSQWGHTVLGLVKVHIQYVSGKTLVSIDLPDLSK